MAPSKILNPLAVASATLAFSVLSVSADDRVAFQDKGIVRLHAPVQTGGVGWQQFFTVTVPKGQNLIYTDTCPSDAKTVVSSSFSPNTAAKVGLQLIASLRPKASSQTWQWEIHWPSGAPSGASIIFNIYCTT
ncbi:MAG: hypothetical protein JO056_11925 [Alphaproteobacteria bacterium]|jgi:hypothetical protein|nr:hypothetical protein [Alphaproteobacteria bacterium]